MPIAFLEYEVAREITPSLHIERQRRSTGLARLWAWLGGGGEGVLVVSAEIEGIRGSIGNGQHGGRVVYRILADISALRGQLPPVWVLGPADGEIHHANIWRARHCELTGGDWPCFCWGGFASKWMQTPASDRTLAGFIEYVKQFLNQENTGSPAR